MNSGLDALIAFFLLCMGFAGGFVTCLYLLKGRL